MLNNTLRSRNIKTCNKTKMFRSNVESVLLNSSVTWNISKPEMNKLHAFIIRFFQRILRRHLPVTISDQQIRNQTRQTPLETDKRSRKFKWLGQTITKGAYASTRQSTEDTNQGSRRPGKLANTCRRQIEAGLQQRDVCWREMISLAK